MSQLNPDTIPRVDLDFMNEDHQTAVALINKLIQLAIAEDSGKIEHSFNALILHHAEHFAHEEEEMVRYGFPPYDCHKGEHERVMAEMQSELENWKESGDSTHLYNYLSNTLVSWFYNHVNTMDSVTATFVKRFQDINLKTH
ncbi:MAG: bacteriohemerythrin [Neptuniibacter sp.]